MTDMLVDAMRETMTSPWVYVLLFGVALLDGFFPVVPSESLVITAGVFAASGSPHLVLVVAVAAAGAACGDHVSYLVGRTAGHRLLGRLRPGTRRHAAFGRASTMLARRGGLVLIVARYIPGGRTAATMTMGATGHPLRSFTVYDLIAALSWGLYSGLVGYVGGAAFEHDPHKGLLVGFGLAVSITALVEVVRHLRERRTSGAAQPAAGALAPSGSPAGAPRSSSSRPSR